jgi:HAD superfamily hydrolase (TIGR01509 family)
MKLQKKEWVVVFDCDGVMFDSRQANINYYNHVRHHFNLPSLIEDEIAYVHMHTGDESISYIFKETEFLDQALEYRRKMDFRPFISDMILEPDLKELLKILKPKLGLAVATNRSNTIGDVLTAYSLDQYFDIVVSSIDVNHPKPHPESIFKILDFFQVDRNHCIYVGDSPVDCQTAEAAKVVFVSYQNPELKSDFQIGRLREVLDVLKSLGVVY